MAVRVKICGLREHEDAQFAVENGADYLGFVFEPSSPRFVGDENWAPDWLGSIEAPKVAVFGVVRSPAPEVFDCIQAHTWEIADSDDYRRFHVWRLKPDMEWSQRVALRAGDAVLLDAYHPTQHGGSGETVDWSLAGEIVRRLPNCRVILAGGLTPENVADAVRKVRPFGVDVSSGVESSPGKKDREKIRNFIEAAKSL